MAASFLKIGGELIQDAILSVVQVTHELNRHSWCVLECRQTKDERFPFEAVLGKELQILTYEEDGSENIAFDGFILKSELEYEISGSYAARITAVSQSYKLALTEQHAYFSKASLKEVAAALVGTDGLDAKVQCKDRRPLNYVQWGECDFDFLRRISDDHGCWMRPTAKGIEISDEFLPGVTVEWRREGGLLSFGMSGELAPGSFSGTHYDPQQMRSNLYKGVHDEPAFFDASAPLAQAVLERSRAGLPSGYLHHRCRMVTLEDYEALLKKESVRSIGGNVVGHGTSRDSRLAPGNTVQIEGALDARGTYGVTKVIHRWVSSGYVNEFWCTPWKNYTEPEPPPPREWPGLAPARVVDHDDPLKMGRIQVQYIWQEDGATHWARMTSPHAGSNRGFMFMPEKGDEVVVAFEDGDPERPVIIGCVWNGVDQAPRQQFREGEIAPNDIKRIVTKSGNRLQMIDKKGQESIVLATPHSIRIAMLEGAPENNNRTTLFVYSSGDILFNAPNGRIHFSSKYFSREVGDHPELDAPPLGNS